MVVATRALPSQTGRPLVIAHRGASAYRPENTPSAFELAIEQRADMIETDLHLTRDRAIAISHDARLEHLGAEGEIADRDLGALRKLDAGDGQSVPTLEEVLDHFAHRIPFNLEIKRSLHGLYEGIEVRCWEAVCARGLESETLFSCFDDRVLAELRRHCEPARLALLLSAQWPQNPIERAVALSCEAINPHLDLVDAAMVEGAHAAGLAVYVYTVDPPEEMNRVLDLGVDGLFTNRPDALRALVEARAADRSA